MRVQAWLESGVWRRAHTRNHKPIAGRSARRRLGMRVADVCWRPRRGRVAMHSAGHQGHVTALHRHPAFPKFFLSCGDWTVRLWSEDVAAPLVTSPCSPVYVTGGAWSPLRPGLAFALSSAGSLAAWDWVHCQEGPALEVRSHRAGLCAAWRATGSAAAPRDSRPQGKAAPSRPASRPTCLPYLPPHMPAPHARPACRPCRQVALASCALTSLAFPPTAACCPSLMAVGAQDGSTHLLHMSDSLAVAVPDEKAALSAVSAVMVHLVWVSGSGLHAFPAAPGLTGVG